MNARLRVVPASRDVPVVSVTAIFSDTRDLLISAWAESDGAPPDGRAVQIVFQRVHGFRVLDGRDLQEFWNEGAGLERGAWLYEVEDGGWLELEKQRSWFSSPVLFPEIREYLVVGERCISVLAALPPSIMTPPPPAPAT